jgi:hypothetical protein
MNVTRSLLNDIKTKELHWYRHVQRMDEGRLTNAMAYGSMCHSQTFSSNPYPEPNQSNSLYRYLLF